MKKLLVLLTLTGLAAISSLMAFAQNDAGPNDTTKSHDYARHIGKSTDKKLSTGWTSGHGTRTHQTNDYMRHNKSGGTTHVHGYYHSSHHK